MTQFVKKDFNPAFKSSQDTIRLLESVSALDLAQTVPYIKIFKLDNKSFEKVGKPINLNFISPPSLGKGLQLSARNSERPAASLQSISIASDQMNGLYIQHQIDISIIVHKSTGLFTLGLDGKPTGDSEWVSLMTPNCFHYLEYGWAGTSKNPLFNRAGYDDKDGLDREGNPVLIGSTNQILFQTKMYDFKISNNGEIEIHIKAIQHGDYLLRRTLALETLKPLYASDGTELLQSQNVLSEERKNSSRKNIQNKLTRARKSAKKKHPKNKKATEYMTLIDIFNNLGLGESITKSSIDWGYKNVKLLIGDINSKCPHRTSKKFGSFAMRGKSIGDFPIPMNDVGKILGNAFKNGGTLTLKNFLHQFIEFLNNTDSWSEIQDQKQEDYEHPQVMIKIAENKFKNDSRELVIMIFDVKKEFVVLDQESEIKKGSRSSTRSELKKRLAANHIPFISLGKGGSFIESAEFEIVKDADIQTVKMVNAEKMIQDRDSLTSETQKKAARSQPEFFHEIFASSVQGSITMLGNFALDTFGYIWLDFDVPLWDGLFAIRSKVDELTPAGFQTTITVYSEARDPYHTKKFTGQDQS